MHILLADDHAMFRSGLRHIIEQEFTDALIEESSSCSDVMLKIRSGFWNLVILDIAMGEDNSLWIVPELKHLVPHVPILILSMYNERQFVIQALRAGAAGYLTKEHTPSELVKAIRTLFDGRRYLCDSIAGHLADYLAMDGSELPHESLSAREREVFELIAKGRTVSEIAQILKISIKTISTYRARILEKLSLGSNAELIRYAIKQGLVD